MSTERMSDDLVADLLRQGERFDLFFLAISGDGRPTRMLIDGRAALRKELSEQFFDPDGPLTPDHREEEAARWASFENAEDDWEFAHGEPFAWHERGEDYAISVYPVTEGRALLDRLRHPEDHRPSDS